MIWYGSLMSQTLQCTQLAELICNRLPQSFFTLSCLIISYTMDGQNRVQGLSYSYEHRVVQI